MKRDIMPQSSTYFMNEAIGSEPGDRTKTSGVQLSESAKQAGRLKVGGSMNF